MVRRRFSKMAAAASCLMAGSAAALSGGVAANAASQPGARQPTLHVVGYGVAQYPHNNGSATAVGAPKSSHCVTLVSDDDGSYPGPFLVEPGTEELRIALHTATKPVKAGLSVYAVKPTSDPHQKAVHPSAHLVRVKGPNGHPTWQLRSALHLAAGQPAYLDLHLAWTDIRCGGLDDFGYTFHVEAAS
jgi:hypothetical protein